MPVSEIMLLHGTNKVGGIKKMAGRTCRKYVNVYNPATGRETRKCVSWRGTRSSSLSGLGSFGQTSGLKATMGSVKGVLVTGGIAAGGAIFTEKLYAKIGDSLGLEGYQKDLAKMATGLVLAFTLGKLLKKPKLAAAFAIGPVVAGVMSLFANIMTPKESGIHGLGLTAFQPVDPYRDMYPALYGANTGLGTTTKFTPASPVAYPGIMPSAQRATYAMPAMV